MTPTATPATRLATALARLELHDERIERLLTRLAHLAERSESGDDKATALHAEARRELEAARRDRPRYALAVEEAAAEAEHDAAAELQQRRGEARTLMRAALANARKADAALRQARKYASACAEVRDSLTAYHDVTNLHREHLSPVWQLDAALASAGLPNISGTYRGSGAPPLSFADQLRPLFGQFLEGEDN